MKVYKFLEDNYITEPPAKGLACNSILVVGFRTRHSGVDVYPNVTKKSYHVVVINEQATTDDYNTFYDLAERIVHIDGVHVDKRKYRHKGDSIVWWCKSILSTEKSTVVMKPEWHSQCLRCGACCSEVALVKGKTILESLDYPCYCCHSGKTTPCPYLIAHNTGTKCKMYKARPNCCRSYPARSTACTFITPTCGLFNKAFIESDKEYQRRYAQEGVLLRKAGLIKD